MKSKLFLGCAASLCSFFLLPISSENEFSSLVPTIKREFCKEAIFTVEDHFETFITQLYEDCSLDKHGLAKNTFRLGIIGYLNLVNTGQLKKLDWLSIVDYDLPSTKERMFIIDLKRRGLFKKVLVAHGKNTGWNYAKNFSNKPQSLQSSLGFYTTAETYSGKYGHSLRLDGLDPNFNCKARDRAIVMHGADYVSRDFIVREGRLGRSWGCLSLTRAQSTQIIDKVTQRSCIYVHRSDEKYKNASTGLNEQKAVDYLAAKEGLQNHKDALFPKED